MKIKTKSLLRWCLDNGKENLINEFSEENIKNIDEINYGSNIPVIWYGKCGHKFEMAPKIRIKGHGCPYCAGQKVLSGFNDLEFWCSKNNSELLNEWDYESNVILPNQIATHSNKKAHWICKHGHKWEMSPKERLNGQGCPYCANKKLLSGFNDFETWCKQNNRIDILQEWDYKKNTFAPSDVIAAQETKIHWVCQHGHEFQQTINERKGGSNCPICSLYKQISFNEKAIAFYVEQHFDIIENYKSNWLGNMSIDVYIPSIKTGIEYDGQRFHNKINDELKNKICNENNVKIIRIREPKCEKLLDNLSTNIQLESLKDVDVENAISTLMNLLGINNVGINIRQDTINILSKVKQYNIEKSLYTYCVKNKMEHILNEWDYSKNKDITPQNVTPRSKHNVFWICENGHSYQAMISNRTKKKGTGCPYCSGRKKIIGINDLKTYCHNNDLTNIINEWSPNNRNMELYSPFSNDKVEWICSKCNHTWQASIDKRIRYNRGCPLCAKVKHNKPVICIETKRFYKNITEASTQSKISDSSISKCCKKGPSYTAGKFHWRYATPEEIESQKTLNT